MLGDTIMMSSGPTAGPGDIFGDGSNLLTSNFSGSSLASVEGNGSGFSVHTGAVGYDSNVPRSGFGKSITMTQNVNAQKLSYALQTGATSADCKAYSFWVYTTRHDDDDNSVVHVNLSRQSGAAQPAQKMIIYVYDNPYSSGGYTYDYFDRIATSTWVHMCIVDEGTTMRTYKDGTSLGTHSIGSKQLLYPNSSYCYSLSDADARNVLFVTGYRFFNRALTQAEVTTLYNENPTY